MLITRTSMLSDITRTLELDVTPEQMAAFKAGVLVQDAFPHLPKNQREFILTGITADEWEEAFPPEED